MATVQLISLDGESIEVDVDVAKKSEVIKNMIEGIVIDFRLWY